MLKKLYIGAGAVLLGGYGMWSLMGWETTASKKELVPQARKYYAGHGARHTGGYRRSSGFFGWGK